MCRTSHCKVRSRLKRETRQGGDLLPKLWTSSLLLTYQAKRFAVRDSQSIPTAQLRMFNSRLQKFGNVVFQFRVTRLIDVHHVAGFEECPGDVFLRLRMNAQMIERVLGSKVRRCQVEIAGAHKD